jgi:excisionase family DNA binding protein
MQDMKHEQTLPLPNPGDWLTTDGAARLLGVHRRTVMRMADRGALTAYEPGTGYGMTAPLMFWAAEVAGVRQARERVRNSRDPGDRR